MRILHTADWHLGKVLKGTDRTPELGGALEELLRLVHSEKIELVLVAGDIFDRAQVTVEAEAVAFRFFRRLYELKVPALVIAGNHDSRERLEALSPLLSLAGATARGEVRLAGKGATVEVAGARVAMLPFLSERRLVKARNLLESEGGDWKGAYDEGMGKIMANVSGEFAGGINILMSHLTMEGSVLGGGEFVFHCTNSYAVGKTRLPLSANYVALGHIHRQQKVEDIPIEAWYPGSLIQLDFGEGEKAPRGALIVEVEPGLAAKVYPINEPWGKALKTFRIKLEDLDRRLEEVAAFPGYARLVIAGRGNAALRMRLFEQFPQLLEVQFDTVESQEQPQPPVEEELDWLEAYQSYSQEAYAAEADGALVNAFKQVYEEVHSNE
jgi:exonuclease SbcD